MCLLLHLRYAFRPRRGSSGFAFSSDCTQSHDPTHVNLQHAPASFDKSSAVVYPKFLTEAEGKSFIKEVSKRMKRKRFEHGHWDSVIVGYREVELRIDDDFSNGTTSDSLNDTSLFVNAIQRTRRHLEERHFLDRPNGCIRWIPCHAIDLSADGRLDAHVDSVKFSGDIVAGISLLSDSILRLKPCSDEWKSENDEERRETLASNSGHVDLYLPQHSLYVLSGMSRFSYTHELLPSRSSFEFTRFESCESKTSDCSGKRIINVDRGRRLSVIFRDELQSKVAQLI